MKNLKLLFKSATLFIISTFYISCDQNSIDPNSSQKRTVIAVQENGNIKIVTDLQKLKSWYTKRINQNGKKFGEITNVYVLEEEGSYFLIGKTSNSTSSTELFIEDSKLYFEKNHGALGERVGDGGEGSSVTCSGCTATGPSSAGSCEPRKGSGGWYCTHCSTNNCEKTTTVNSGNYQ